MVSILLCDGASSNLTVLKLLSGGPKAQFPTNVDAETLSERYNVEASFINPEDPHGNPVFLMICPSHQVLEMLLIKLALLDVLYYCMGHVRGNEMPFKLLEVTDQNPSHIQRFVCNGCCRV